MKFTLEIELGNDAMQTYGDIRRALYRLIEDSPGRGTLKPGEGAAIMDLNGNKVGKWEVVD